SFDLALAVGEAVANAIEHAYQEAPGDFMLRLSLRDDTIFGEVQDLGSWREPCPSSDRGRGLEILAAITRSFEVSRGAAGTTVAFAL
ncbi:MAG: ATP-binding protein, partial [Candidatus Cybelea sp.]